MPTSELVVRLTIPAILAVAVVGVFLALRWERRHPSSYPGSRRHAGDLNLAWWRSLSTASQAAHDAAAIEAVAAAEADAEDAARAAVERARVNALFHP